MALGRRRCGVGARPGRGRLRQLIKVELDFIVIFVVNASVLDTVVLDAGIDDLLRTAADEGPV
jgi:hypothetical protein